MTTTEVAAPSATEPHNWSAGSSAPGWGPPSCAPSTWASTWGCTGRWTTRRPRRPNWPTAPAATSGTCGSGCRGRPIAGLLAVDGPDPATARFALADGTHDVLVDETARPTSAGLPTSSPPSAGVLPLLVDAYRTGDGRAVRRLRPGRGQRASRR